MKKVVREKILQFFADNDIQMTEGEFVDYGYWSKLISELNVHEARNALVSILNGAPFEIGMLVALRKIKGEFK